MNNNLYAPNVQFRDKLQEPNMAERGNAEEAGEGGGGREEGRVQHEGYVQVICSKKLL